MSFEKCINTPGPMEKLTEVDKLKTDIDNLLKSIKEVVDKITDVGNNAEKEGWIKTMARIIVTQAGFLNQLTKMRDCYWESKSKNAKLAEKLLGSYKP